MNGVHAESNEPIHWHMRLIDAQLEELTEEFHHWKQAVGENL